MTYRIPPGFPNEDVPGIVYHYTDERGFLGIMESRRLWATSIYHLNDRREFDHARDLIGERILRRQADLKSTELQVVLGEVRNALDVLEAQLPIFVTAFSETSDDLSQWRAYGRLPGGYAIGFDSLKLKQAAQEAALQSEAIRLGRCEYDDELIGEPVEILIDAVLKEYESSSPEQSERFTSDRSIIRDLKKRFAFTFGHMAPFVKDKAFESEKEWRLVVGAIPRESTLLPYKFREGGASIIPYVEVLFGGLDAIREIWVGPTSMEDRPRVDAALQLLTEEAEELNVHFSRAPLRT